MLKIIFWGFSRKSSGSAVGDRRPFLIPRLTGAVVMSWIVTRGP